MVPDSSTPTTGIHATATNIHVHHNAALSSGGEAISMAAWSQPMTTQSGRIARPSQTPHRGTSQRISTSVPSRPVPSPAARNVPTALGRMLRRLSTWRRSRKRSSPTVPEKVAPPIRVPVAARKRSRTTSGGASTRKRRISTAFRSGSTLMDPSVQAPPPTPAQGSSQGSARRATS